MWALGGVARGGDRLDSIVFIEAAASGVPAIAGRSGGSHEAVRDGETGFVVEPRDAGALQQAIRNLDDSGLQIVLVVADDGRLLGTITDGGIRDLDEMTNAGFKALARRLCVGHAHSHPVRWNCPVEVFGRAVSPGALIHADKHGFLAVAPDEAPGLLAAARFMDANECRTVIPAARDTAGRSTDEILDRLNRAAAEFGRNARAEFRRGGEW